MGAKTLTISIPEEMYEYLKNDGLLKPSAIFQQAIKQIRDSRVEDVIQIRVLQNKCKILQNKIFELQDEK